MEGGIKSCVTVIVATSLVTLKLRIRAITRNLKPYNQDGFKFRVIARILSLSVTSEVATITVTQDLIPPSIVSVGSLDGYTIGVCFSEPVAPGEVLDPYNWFIDGFLLVSSASISADGRSALLTLDPSNVDPSAPHIPLGSNYTVSAALLFDRSAAANFVEYSSAVGRVENLTAQDIGRPTDPLKPGSTFVCSSNQFTVVAGGSDIWNTTNGFHFIYRPKTGDFDVRVRVSRLDPADPNSKAGLIALEDTNNASRTISAVVTPSPVPTLDLGGNGANTYQAGVRSTFAGATVDWGVNPRITPVPYPNAWLRLQREGNVFTAYWGTNGMDWGQYGVTTQAFNTALLVGMGVTAHSNAATTTINVFTTAILNDFLFVAPPTIISSPTNTVVVSGNTANLTVNASGPVEGGSLRYQWRFNGLNIAGETNAVLTIANAQSVHAGNYDVIVRNSAGAVTSATASLTVVFPPNITQQPTSQNTGCRGDATFSVVATGTAPLSYQWYFNATNLISNATNNTLTLTNVSLANAGNYSVVISNVAGTD